MGDTIIRIVGDDFHLNGRPTYPGRRHRGARVEGLLMNARLIQGVFDDLNPQTRGRWDYPDGPWDPGRNTDAFVAAMPAWRAHGLLSFTVGLQGGSPEGYSRDQPWHNSAFTADGAPRPAYFDRLARILDAADRLGMAPIVSLFYFGQDQRLDDEAAVIAATDATTDWLLARGDRHVLIEIANEVDVPKYTHDLLKPARVAELVERVRDRSAGRLPVGTSFMGGSVPTDDVIAASDLVLMHGNGVGEPHTGDPAALRGMVAEVRRRPAFRGQPVVFNEDDHFAFDADDNPLLAAVGEHASWGYFDYRFAGEGFADGYQCMPCDWGIGSPRKRGFFGLLAAVTGAQP